MEKIIKNGREFYKFRIGDEFEAVLGDSVEISKKIKEGLASYTYNKKKGYVYPVYTGSNSNNHISGYSNKWNINSKGIKISGVGAGAGKTKFIDGKNNILKNCYVLTSEICNEYISNYLQKKLEKYIQKTTMPSLQFSYIKNVIIEIPFNHNEFAKLFRKINEYKELNKQLIKQFKDYKLGILQEAENAIEKHKKEGNHDKYLSFKISDEFTKFSGRGKGMFSTLNATKEKIKNNTFELYTNVTQNNHISGYVDKYNFNSKGIKWTEVGDAGATKFIDYKVYIGEGGNVMISNIFANEYIAEHLARIIPKYTQGSTMRHAKWPYFKDVKIHIPINHKELSKIIKQIDDWEELINKTTKKMEKYIEGILQLSLEGVTNE